MKHFIKQDQITGCIDNFVVFLIGALGLSERWEQAKELCEKCGRDAMMVYMCDRENCCVIIQSHTQCKDPEENGLSAVCIPFHLMETDIVTAFLKKIGFYDDANYLWRGNHHREHEQASLSKN